MLSPGLYAGDRGLVVKTMMTLGFRALRPLRRSPRAARVQVASQVVHKRVSAPSRKSTRGALWSRGTGVMGINVLFLACAR